MPWAYWLGLVLFGALTIGMVVSAASAWITGGRPSVIGAVIFLVVLVTLIWFYGPRRAFEVTLDGGEVVWRAPMLTRRVPIDRIDEVSTNKSPFTAAEPCLVLDDGSRLVVAVSGQQQTQDFQELVAELTSRRPTLQVTYVVP